jgi:hypothetical protein
MKIGNESLHEMSNDNGVRAVNFATSKNPTVKSTMFPHTWTVPDGKTHNQIDHILVGRRRHSNVLDVRTYRAADCNTDHYLVVTKVRERVAVNIQRSHRFHTERFNLKKLNEVEGKEKYHVEVSKRLAALEDLDAEVVINSARETTRKNIKRSGEGSLGYYKLKKHKPWFNEGCSESSDQRKQTRLQWLQDPSEINGNNLNIVRLEASRHIRKKRETIREEKLMSLQRTIRTITSERG